jgi:hypothetical protein
MAGSSKDELMKLKQRARVRGQQTSASHISSLLGGAIMGAVAASQSTTEFQTLSEKLKEDNNADVIRGIVDEHISKSVANALLAMTPEQRDGVRVLLDKLEEQGG